MNIGDTVIDYTYVQILIYVDIDMDMDMGMGTHTDTDTEYGVDLIHKHSWIYITNDIYYYVIHINMKYMNICKCYICIWFMIYH